MNHLSLYLQLLRHM